MQDGCHAIRRFRAVLRNLVDADNGLPVAPAFYVTFGAAAGLLASLLLKERARDVDLTATDLEVAVG
jgi:hypothetical protein